MKSKLNPRAGALSALAAMASTGVVMGCAHRADVESLINSDPQLMQNMFNMAGARSAATEDQSCEHMTLEDIEANLQANKKIVARINADARGGTLTDREERRIEDAQESIAVLEVAAEARSRPAGRKTTPQLYDEARGQYQAHAPARPSTPIYASPRAGDAGRGGFKSVGDFLNSVIQSSAQGAQVDSRLIFDSVPTSFGSEGVGADGGFAVPPDFRDQITQKVMGEDSLLSLTDQQTSSGNSITFPVDETTPWQSSGGIQAFWEVEGGQKQQSKPALVEKTVKLNKVIALVPLTDELLEDSPAMASYVNRKAPEKIVFKVNDAILNGSGVGMPLGILKSPGTVVITKESGQAADTLVFANIQKLWAAVTPAARRNARWIMNPDVESQLNGMSFPGTGTAVPVYLPPGGLSAAPYGTLMGRPIVYSEAAPALGDEGDITLGDLSNYLTAVKRGGIRADVSIHVWFDYDITAFRFVMRVGGQPWWNAPVQPFQTGATARGFFAALGARA